MGQYENCKRQIKIVLKQALKKQKATGAKPAVPKEKVIETPSVDKVNTANFLANKGKLPWPTSNGFISEKYGTHAHPNYLWR